MNYDVVIVGASFAGLTLAHYLPRDLKVLVLDLKKNLNDAVESTGLITQVTYDLLDDFVDVKSFVPNKIDSIGVIGTDYERNFFSYTEDPWIYSTDTPNLLKHMAESLPKNVDLSIDSTFKSCVKMNEQEDDYVLNVNFVKAGKKTDVRAKFLVGADGARSAVAKNDENLSKNKKILIGLEKVFYGDILFGPNPESAVYHYWFGEFSLGYGGWLSPTVINGRKAFRLGLAKRAKNVNEFYKIDKFIEKLQEKKMIKIDGETEEDLTFASMIPIGGPLKKVFTDHSILIGDAAGLCGAFAADGIKGALVSAKVAADLIPRHLGGERRVLHSFYPEIQKFNGLMTYYRKQVFYRWIWDFMKSNRTFDTMFDIIARAKEDFLNHFCDSKDRNKSLMSVVLRFSNLPILFKYAWYMFLDLFKRC